MHRTRVEAFSDIFKTPEGNCFFGEMGNPGSYPRPRKEFQNLPHRALVVGRSSVAQSGMIVTGGGSRFMLLDQYSMVGVRRFLAAEVHEEAVWVRTSKIIDAVTRLERGSTPVVMNANLPVVRDPRSTNEEVHFDRPMWRIFTTADVKVGDMLDNLKVHSRYELLGLQMLEAS